MKRYGYSSPHESSYLQEVMKTSPLFAIRMKYLDLFVFKKKYRLCQGEEQIVAEMRKYIEQYLSKKENKCKVKRK